MLEAKVKRFLSVGFARWVSRSLNEQKLLAKTVDYCTFHVIYSKWVGAYLRQVSRSLDQAVKAQSRALISRYLRIELEKKLNFS